MSDDYFKCHPSIFILLCGYLTSLEKKLYV